MLCCVSKKAAAGTDLEARLGRSRAHHSLALFPHPEDPKPKTEKHQVDLPPDDGANDDVPPILLPCAICARTFKPQSLEKHARICERTAVKRRKPFDSAKQRIQGTELAEFLPKQEKKRPYHEDRTCKPSSSWKQTHDEFLRAIRAARGDSVDSKVPPAISTGAPTRANEKGMCPTCNRQFGIKAYDRHVAWCKERATRLPVSPATNVAKERLEARMKYRAPAMRNRRPTNREKYAPGSAINLSTGNKTSPTSYTSRAKESVSSPNCNKISDSPGKTKPSPVRRSGHNREPPVTSSANKSRLTMDHSIRLTEDCESGLTSSRSSRRDLRRSFQLPSASPGKTRSDLLLTRSSAEARKIETGGSRADRVVNCSNGKTDGVRRTQRINLVSARSCGNPKLNDVAINDRVIGISVYPCNIHENRIGDERNHECIDSEQVTWKQIRQDIHRSKNHPPKMRFKIEELQLPTCRDLQETKEPYHDNECQVKFECQTPESIAKSLEDECRNSFCIEDNITWINKVQKLDQTYLIKESKDEKMNMTTESSTKESTCDQNSPILDIRLKSKDELKLSDNITLTLNVNDANISENERNQDYRSYDESMRNLLSKKLRDSSNNPLVEIFPDSMSVAVTVNSIDHETDIKEMKRLNNMCKTEMVPVNISPYKQTSVDSKDENTFKKYPHLQHYIDNSGTLRGAERTVKTVDHFVKSPNSIDAKPVILEQKDKVETQVEVKDPNCGNCLNISTLQNEKETKNEVLKENVKIVKNSLKSGVKKDINLNSPTLSASPKFNNRLAQSLNVTAIEYNLIKNSNDMNETLQVNSFLKDNHKNNLEIIDNLSEHYGRASNISPIDTCSPGHTLTTQKFGDWNLKDGTKIDCTINSEEKELSYNAKLNSDNLEVNGYSVRSKAVSQKRCGTYVIQKPPELLNAEDRKESPDSRPAKKLRITKTDGNAIESESGKRYKKRKVTTGLQENANISSIGTSTFFTETTNEIIVSGHEKKDANKNFSNVSHDSVTNNQNLSNDTDNKPFIQDSRVSDGQNIVDVKVKSLSDPHVKSEKLRASSDIKKKIRHNMNLLRGSTDTLVSSFEITQSNPGIISSPCTTEICSIEPICEENKTRTYNINSIDEDNSQEKCNTLPRIGNGNSREVFSKKSSPFYWQKALKVSSSRLITLDPPKQEGLKVLWKNPTIQTLPPVASNNLPARRRSNVRKDYDPFLLAERQLNELLSDTSESLQEGPRERNTSESSSNYPLSHSSAFAKYPAPPSSVTNKRTSLIAPPTEFDDLMSDFSSDSTETNSISKEVKLENHSRAKETIEPHRSLNVSTRLVVLDKSKPFTVNEHDEANGNRGRSFINSVEKSRKILEKVTPKVMRPTVSRCNSVRASSAPKGPERKDSIRSSVKKACPKTTNYSKTNSTARNNNYNVLSESNLSLSSIVSSDVDIKRSNSMFDELTSSFEEDVSSFPSLRSFLKSNSMSVPSPIQHSQQRNGLVSDEELSSPDSYKRQDHGKISADSAYSSLNRKYFNHGCSVNDGGSRLDDDIGSGPRDDTGTPVKYKMSKFCHECGSKFPETAKFCCECGIKRLAL